MSCMVMRFASLGSGSAGNALLVQSATTCLLLDCGFSARETERRLQRFGIAAEHLHGILVTHEHGDHVGGVFRLARRYGLPVWLTAGTLKACAESAVGCDCRVIDSHQLLALGDIAVQAFPVPHDAREPVQFVFTVAGRRLGVLTDVGMVTPHICAMLSGCDALVLECNHDALMLEASLYPASLKRRIAGRLGHLENSAAAGLLALIDASRLQHLIAAHLSERNNAPDLAVAALAGVLGCSLEFVAVACPQQGFDWREISL